MSVENEVLFRSDMTVELVKHSASDADIVWAARVSTAGERSLEDLNADPAESAGLINYLIRERHGSPVEHAVMTFYVEAPIFVFREFMRHRIACITGDTLISFRNGNPKAGARLKTIQKHYEHWHYGVEDSLGRRRILPSVKNAEVQTVNEDTLEVELGNILDIVQTGVKKVYRVTTENGYTIKTSIDHRFFTPEGWRTLKELQVGDEVYVRARKGKNNSGEGTIPRSLRSGIQVWVSQRRKRLLQDADFTCVKCNNKFTPQELRVDHIIPVVEDLSLALTENNLQILCVKCDRIKTSSEQILANRSFVFSLVDGRRIKSIEYAGEEMTYDLVLAGPNHNFFGNNFVIHNSYNESSGRYRELRPTFYVPARERNLVQQGKPGAYDFVPGSEEQYNLVVEETKKAYVQSYEAYQSMLNAGVAREVARIVLPVGLYSQMFVTMNARSLMNFISLRTKREGSHFPSYPQREIEMVAEKMEHFWAELMPITYDAFNKAGRVSP